jgi:hypothetical protein
MTTFFLIGAVTIMVFLCFIGHASPEFRELNRYILALKRTDSKRLDLAVEQPSLLGRRSRRRRLIS